MRDEESGPAKQGGRGHGPSTFFKAKKIFFKNVCQKVKGCPKEERELMPHIVHAIKLLLVNLNSCQQEREYSSISKSLFSCIQLFSKGYSGFLGLLFFQNIFHSKLSNFLCFESFYSRSYFQSINLIYSLL